MKKEIKLPKDLSSLSAIRDALPQKLQAQIPVAANKPVDSHEAEQEETNGCLPYHTNN